MLGFSQSPYASLTGLEAVAIDCETTGLDAQSARIIQIGGVAISLGSVNEADAFNRLVDPGIKIPPPSTRVHGITDADIAGQPAFKEMAGAFEDFLKHRPVIGHSIAYDLAMLSREHALAGIAWHAPRALDIRLLARVVAPSLAEHDLDSLCSWLGVAIVGRHTAYGDALATAQAFVKLVPMLRARGIRTIAEAEAACIELSARDARAGGGLIAASPVTREFSFALSRLDAFAYRHRVSDVMSAPAVVLDGDTQLGTAVATMLGDGLSSVFVALDSGEHGIVTERDALRALNESGADAPQWPLSRIAQAPLIGMDRDDFVFKAIGRMERLSIRHLAVFGAGRSIIGALTPRNLLRNRATASISIGDGIAAARTVSELAACWAEAPRVAQALLADGVDARAIANVLSAAICGITERTAELAVERMVAEVQGNPPAPFAVLVLGSAGRGESLLAADQDNAIAYESGEAGGATDRWFEQMAVHMNDMLDQVGIAFCKGGVMAKSAEWRRSRRGWEALAASWVRRQKPADLLNVDIFFDATTVHGDGGLGDGIVAHARELAQSSRDFMMLLTELARQWQSPLTLFGGFQKANGRVDVKKAGLMPIFTGARILALRHGVDARSTPERLRGVLARGIGAKDTIYSIIDAHEVLLRSILEQQLEDGRMGVPLSAKVDVDRLSREARRELKEAIQTVALVIDLVAEGRQ